jgi:hypothetical protein
MEMYQETSGSSLAAHGRCTQVPLRQRLAAPTRVYDYLDYLPRLVSTRKLVEDGSRDISN